MRKANDEREKISKRKKVNYSGNELNKRANKEILTNPA